VQLGERIPAPVRSLMGAIPLLRPVIPDPGTPFQLVHAEDVAHALIAAVVGGGEPGVYNLAAEGEVTLSDLAHALGWYAMPVPELTIDLTARVVSKLPLMPSRAAWISAIRVPVLMDCTKAREKLGWEPQNDVLDTLADTIAGAREKGLPIGRP
jgi:UDP-glucose 4-epimerase